MKRLITLVALVGALAVVLVPAAGARVYQEGSDAGPLDPWTLNLFARQNAATLSSQDPTVVQQPVANAADDGVNVGIIAIGVGSGFVALLLVTGLVAVTRRSRRQQPAHA